MQKSILAIVLLFIVSAVSAYSVTNFYVDESSGTAYVITDANELHVVSNIDSITDYSVKSYYTGSFSPDTVHVLTQGSEKRLYFGFEKEPRQVGFGYITLPITTAEHNNLTLTAEKSTDGISMSPFLAKYITNSGKTYYTSKTYNSGQPKIDLRDVVTLNVKFSISPFPKLRSGSENIVYNKNNQHIIAINTPKPSSGSRVYGTVMKEYLLTANNLTMVDSTYDCFCNGNYTASESPYFKQGLQQCDIIYDSNTLICISDDSQYYKLPADDLSKLTIVNFTVVDVVYNGEFLTWDFDNERSLFTYNGSIVSAAIDNGQVETVCSLDNYVVYRPAYLYGDYLFASIYQVNETEPAEILAINLNTCAKTVITAQSTNSTDDDDSHHGGGHHHHHDDSDSDSDSDSDGSDDDDNNDDDNCDCDGGCGNWPSTPENNSTTNATTTTQAPNVTTTAAPITTKAAATSTAAPVTTTAAPVTTTTTKSALTTPSGTSGNTGRSDGQISSATTTAASVVGALLVALALVC